MLNNIIRIHPQDNVAVTLAAIARGQALTGAGLAGLSALTDIPLHHKVALVEIAADATILKYGEPIAAAKSPIKAGEWVHHHNLKG